MIGQTVVRDDGTHGIVMDECDAFLLVLWSDGTMGTIDSSNPPTPA